MWYDNVKDGMLPVANNYTYENFHQVGIILWGSLERVFYFYWLFLRSRVSPSNFIYIWLL